MRAVRVVRPRTVKVEEAADTVCLNELSIGIVLPFPPTRYTLELPTL